MGPCNRLTTSELSLSYTAAPVCLLPSRNFPHGSLRRNCCFCCLHLKKGQISQFFLDFSMTMLATFCQRASNHSPHVLKLYIQYIKFFPPNLLIQKSFYPVSKATAFQSFDEQHNQYKQKKRMLLRKIVCQNGLLNHQS